MSGKRENHYLPLVILVAFMVIFPPTIFGDLATDPWTKYVYNYQTLLAGIFAVGAAVVTVRQMQESEKNQDLRHQRMMNRDNRVDNLAIQRLRHYLPEWLRADAETLNDFVQDYANEPIGMLDATWLERRRSAFISSVYCGKKIDRYLDFGHVRKCEHLFTPQLEEELRYCERMARALGSKIPDAFFEPDFQNPIAGESEPDYYSVEAIRYIQRLGQMAELLAADIEKWADSILVDD